MRLMNRSWKRWRPITFLGAVMPTKINWCDETWNPITGCTPISPGCAHCYAKKMANRLKGRYGYPKDDPFGLVIHEDRFRQPRKWKLPKRIFVCSMGDLFHEELPFEWIAKVLLSAAKAPQHQYLLLTKRPGYVREFDEWSETIGVDRGCWLSPWQKNLWLGVSCENQEWADKRIPHLLKIPAAVRWLSLEPLLGPIDLIGDLSGGLRCDQCGYTNRDAGIHMDHSICTNKYGGHGWANWVVVGCESGQGRRPCKLEWVRKIVEQCEEANVPVWVKQIEIDGKVETDMDKFPKELQVRELPK